MASSSRNEKVMSLEDKVRIIRDFAVLYHRKDKVYYLKKYKNILMNRTKILHQYDDMKAKLAAVRDLVITEYGKPNYIGEKHALLQKVIAEWYQRAEASPHIKKVTLGLFTHKMNTAMRILNITGLPMSETQICRLKSKCHEDGLERTVEFESTTLNIKKIIQELLVKMGIPKSTAVNMYGPNIFEEEVDDDEDYEDFEKATDNPRNNFGKRKLSQAKLPSCKTPRTLNDKGVWGLDEDWTELVQCESESEVEELDASDVHSETNLLTSEAEAAEGNQNEKEDLELYDVIIVEDSTDDPDTATSPDNIIPNMCIKKEFETSIDSEKEVVVPSTIIKEEPDSGQSAENYTIDYVREMGEDWIKKEKFESADDEGYNQELTETLEPKYSIKIKNEASDGNIENCDDMSKSTYFQDCVKQETKEGIYYREMNIDSDKEGSVELFTDTREDSSDFNAVSATMSLRNNWRVDNDQDAIRTLELLKRYLRQQQNGRALEALTEVEAALLRSAKKSSKNKK